MVGDRVTPHCLDLFVFITLLSELIFIAFKFLQYIAIVLDKALKELLLLLVSLHDRSQVFLLRRLYHLARDRPVCHFSLSSFFN